MFRSNIYTKMILLVSFMVFGLNSSFAQANLEFKLQLMNDTCWGVYVTPVGVTPTDLLTTASGQVTVVMPDGFNWTNLTSVGGQWINNASNFAPVEPDDPYPQTRQYISFGLNQAEPIFPIDLAAGEETLLFTFCSSDPCPDSLFLIDCNSISGVTDGFCPDMPDSTPGTNSVGNNPGNDLSMIDFGQSPNQFYNWQDNYAPSAWSCHDCDGDGIPNGLEDTNGDGTWTPGVDTSDMCDPCDPYHIQSATLDFISDADVICAGDIGDTAYLVVDIVNFTGTDTTKYDGLGWDPFMVVFDDGSGAPYDTIFDYASGDSIPVVPSGTETFTLVTVLDSFLCSAPDSLFGSPSIEVHGPISTTDPSPVTECSEDGNSFSVTGTNAGDGVITYNWQLSTDDGATYGNLLNVLPYSQVQTNTMVIDEVAGLNGYWYRCAIATEVCDTVYSNWAELTVDGPIAVSASPADITVCDGGAVTFTGGGTNTGVPGAMLYQWQESQDNGATWSDVTGGVFSNETTTTVTLTGIDVSMDGYQYRMAIYTPTCDRIFTEEAILDVQGPLSFAAHPADFSNCAGSQVFFAFEYANPGTGNVTYQWQQSCDSGATWSNLVEGDPYGGTNGVNDGSNGFGDTLVIADVIGLNGCLYRVQLNTSTCSAIASNSATLDVSGNAEFTDISADDILVCSGSDTIIVACATIPQGDFYWSWEYSDDLGVTWDSLEMTGVFSSSSAGSLMSTGCDSLIISDVAGMYDYKFRAIAQATDCAGEASEEVQLRVEGPLAVSTQPLDTTECAGNPTTFTAAIANPGFSATDFIWQISVDGGANFIDLNNNALYGGVNSSTLIIADVTGMDQYQFLLSAQSGNCGRVYSSPATLTVEGPILYSQADDPQDVTLCYDDSFSFTSAASLAQAGTVEYQWQVTSDDGVNWNDITALTDGGVYTNFTTATLNGSSADGLYNRCYRLAFSTGKCSELYSSMACLTVQGEITITDQPDPITECSGDPVTFIVDIDDASPDYTNEDYIYFQWQESTDNGTTFLNLNDGLIINGGSGVAGANSDTIIVTETAGRDDNLFRVLVWTDVCDTLTSAEVSFSIEGPVAFIDDPDNISECSGSGVTFTASTANPGLGTVEYQWEISTDDGATYSNVSNGTVNGYSGSGSNTLVINDVVGLYDERFRLKAWTQYCDTLWSNYAVLSVEGPIEFTNMPDDATICSGNPVCFEVETFNNSTSAISSAITYQWQIQPSGLTSWTNLSNNATINGVTSANLCISDVVGLDSSRYRVLIQTDNCASVVSDSALLVVEGPVTFSRHPEDITQCSTEEIYFVGEAAIAVGNSGTISYQWQISSDGVNFNDIVAPGLNSYAGVDTDSLIIGDVSGLHGSYFRLSANTGVCSEVYSFDAQLEVEGPLGISLEPVAVTNCDDKEALFFSNVTNGAQLGQDGINFQWQTSTDNGTTWTDVPNGDNGTNLVNGAETDTLLIAPVTNMNGHLFRMKTWTATCDTLTTAEVILNVEGPITFTDQPDDVTLCSEDGTCFTVAIDNSTGVGSVSYQWEVSANGVIWSDVSNGGTGTGLPGTYTGATTNQLCISDIAGLYNYKYRCKVRTVECEYVFSQLAQLFVEGPITFDAQPPALVTICDNVGYTIESDISLPASSSGALSFQWQENDGGGWTNIANNELTGGGFSMYSNDTGTETGEYFGVTTDDLDISLCVGMDGYQFRLVIWTSTCADTSDIVTLDVLDACSTGTCDFDLDGQINDTDTDDDNDLLADFWEDWITANYNIVHTDTFIGAGPFAYTDDLSLQLAYSNCDRDTDNDNIIDGLEDPDGDLLSNAEETDGDGIFDGNPLDPCDPILGPTCIGVSLAIDVNLQGPKISVSSSNALMRDNLRAKDTIPAFEPYGAMNAFTHVGDGGTEYLTQSGADAVFGVTGANAIVDWVFVELRSSTNLDSVITTRSAFLQRDGDVVDIDGLADLTFAAAPAGPYYVSVRHRNHLGIMSAEALDLSPITAEVDFTDPTTPTYGDHAQIELGDGEMYMWAGDVNSDGRTIYQGPGTDVFQIFLQVLSDPANDDGLANFISTGYLQADIDMDYDAVYQGPSNDRALLFFNTTLQHPENTSNLANYVIIETLP